MARLVMGEPRPSRGAFRASLRRRGAGPTLLRRSIPSVPPDRRPPAGATAPARPDPARGLDFAEDSAGIAPDLPRNRVHRCPRLGPPGASRRVSGAVGGQLAASGGGRSSRCPRAGPPIGPFPHHGGQPTGPGASDGPPAPVAARGAAATPGTIGPPSSRLQGLATGRRRPSHRGRPGQPPAPREGAAGLVGGHGPGGLVKQGPQGCDPEPSSGLGGGRVRRLGLNGGRLPNCCQRADWRERKGSRLVDATPYAVTVPETGLEPARACKPTSPSSWRVCQFRHSGSRWGAKNPYLTAASGGVKRLAPRGGGSPRTRRGFGAKIRPEIAKR